MELLKDYDLTINYHPKKANIVADALSRKSSAKLVVLITSQKTVLVDLERLGIEVRLYEANSQITNLIVQPTLITRI